MPSTLGAIEEFRDDRDDFLGEFDVLGFLWD